MRPDVDITIRVSCPECGRRDTIVGTQPPDKSLQEARGWVLRAGRFVCGNCAKQAQK